MAYENNNAAYDLSLFDDEVYTSAAPARELEDEPVRKVKKKQKTKIVEFSEDDINAIIVGQVQLTELNQKIISAQETLADTQSIYTQNQMKLEASLSNAEIEKHATEVLGMTKASNAQKEFVSIESGDKAEVSAQKGENIFTQFIESIKNLWS